MLETVDVGRVELLKCRRFVRDGLTRTVCEERLDSLKQQPVDAMRSGLDLMTQWVVLGEVNPAEIYGTGMEFSMK